MALTPKQEKFCQSYVFLGDKSAAYREAYSTERMKASTINRKAVKLSNEGKIRARITELRGKIEEEDLYTLRESILRDLKLINRYEKALGILEDETGDPMKIEASERMIRFIGANGYNSAQERLSKQHGFYEKDNDQKKDDNIVVFKIPDNGRG